MCVCVCVCENLPTREKQQFRVSIRMVQVAQGRCSHSLFTFRWIRLILCSLSRREWLIENRRPSCSTFVCSSSLLVCACSSLTGRLVSTRTVRERASSTSSSQPSRTAPFCFITLFQLKFGLRFAGPSKQTPPLSIRLVIEPFRVDSIDLPSIQTLSRSRYLLLISFCAC